MKRLFLLFIFSFSMGQKIIIPMDQAQNDHLKAYGIAYFTLAKNTNIEWLLNYRGGSFLLDAHQFVQTECRIRGVTFEQVNAAGLINIYSAIEQGNMDIVLLEKKPKIAIYSPPNKQPWDDAVTLALTYAEVDYETLWDEEVHLGQLEKYDWLHLHHEDFTGQYGKFYRSHHNAQWYRDQKQQFEAVAAKLGYPSVHEQKKAIARIIKSYVGNGGFLFAMCSATDSYDIALSMGNVDGVHSVFDGSSINPNIQSSLDYGQSFAFANFKLLPDPMVYEFSDIDFPPSHNPVTRGAEADYFSLFEFSAKYDPVPTMLTQNHVAIVKGFMGQTTGFHKDRIKNHIVIMGDDPASDQVKYLHGNFGKGTFTFYGGHDPEDYQHFVGDPPTDLSLHRNSPGYRLILNNILFPAARKKERKT
ncbi:MAG: asparagine synthetase B [Candidatus Neomarinimicrobiota bacterium]|nr:asparagine synthetase B [Candidatus Neomarinimicrobiota bacterium]MEE3189116.1 asparagine synthetase B [Candidatus Neomarinimicrobiota bacterium]|tara:strand:- start:3541 stop:4788 length:1248 start_codon:yes stop_codon:yes gene_type:complete